MSGPYEDIIHLPHHVSSTRQRMSIGDRAAQFSPFAALAGYEAAIKETERMTGDQIDLDVDEIAALNEKIQMLMEHLDECPEVAVTYFVPDERKSGGCYIQTVGRVKKIDSDAQVILMDDGEKIHFTCLLDICTDIGTG